MDLNYTPRRFIADNALVSYAAQSVPYKVYYGTNVGLTTITIKVN